MPHPGYDTQANDANGANGVNESSILVPKTAKTYLAIDQKKRNNKLGNLIFDSQCRGGKLRKCKGGNVSMTNQGGGKRLDKFKGNMSVEMGEVRGLDSSLCNGNSGVHSKGTLVGKPKLSTRQRGSPD